jgi:hypothetical protein
MFAIVLTLAVLFQLQAPIAPSVERGDPARPTQRTDKTEENHQPNAVVPNDTANGRGDHQDAAQKPEQRNEHNSDWLTGGSTFVIAIFTIISAIIFAYQIRAAHFTERAWVLVSKFFKSDHLEWPDMRPDVNPTESVAWSLTNAGHTPARIRSVEARFHVIDRMESLPTYPNYGDGQCLKFDEIPTDGTMIAPDEIFNVTVYFEGSDGKPSAPTQEQIDAVREHNALLVAYGFVGYDDAFKKAHETRFCYVYHVNKLDQRGGFSGWFSPGGPEKYNLTK